MTMGWIKRVKLILEMIKFEHTVFALPFAYFGAVLGSLVVMDRLPSWGQIGWVTLAMVGARSAAMALNRLIDRHIDARNPRTANRAIPAGQISVRAVWWFVIVSFLVLFIAAYNLNRLAVQLFPLAVFVLVIYSYTKRFTWTCHLVLGAAIGLAPLGGWVATTGQIDGVALLLFATVALWTAGFDVIYACQDEGFDREEGLYSIPARFGLARALQMARWFHVGTTLGLLLLWLLTPLSGWFFVGVLVAAAILIYEHRIVSPDDLSRLNTAFFTMNGIMSVVVFLFAMVDVILG
ncbi:MAG: UbiA-like polyprenyltransferase [Planifilum sp.]|jgi:4-hydroxybenzoate polyprenyltransferase